MRAHCFFSQGSYVAGKQQNKEHRSTFSFDNQSKKGKKAGGGKDVGLPSQSPIQAIPTIKTSAPPPNLSGPGPRCALGCPVHVFLGGCKFLYRGAIVMVCWYEGMQQPGRLALQWPVLDMCIGCGAASYYYSLH
eukprot:1090096-Pelagomonas_calceolata.AAC.1